MTNDFCKKFALQEEEYRIEGKQKDIITSPTEIMVILILPHSGGFRYFTHYYKENLFPNRTLQTSFLQQYIITDSLSPIAAYYSFREEPRH